MLRVKHVVQALVIALMVLALVPGVASAKADDVVGSSTPPAVSFASEAEAYTQSDEVIICWGWSSHNVHSRSIWFESAQSCTAPIDRHTVAVDLQKYSETLGWYTVEVETKTCYNTYGCAASGVYECVNPGYFRVEGTHIVQNEGQTDYDDSASGPFWC